MYNINEYNNLATKYGGYASWAIWSYKNASDTTVIEQNYDQLNSKYILLGLNISGPLSKESWLNFHGGSTHDRKLKFACNDTVLRGSYMTDIFKGIEEVQAANLSNSLTDRIINENVNIFNQEMSDIKLDNDSQFIIFGTHAAKYFNEYFKHTFKNTSIYYNHYSYYGISDREWVTGFWKKLNVNQSFDMTVKKYKK